MHTACPFLSTGKDTGRENEMAGKTSIAEEEVMKRDCAFCRGTGKDPFELLSSRSLCQVCGGKGVVTVRTPAFKCAYCGGTGIHPQRRMVCTVCQGKGAVSILKPVETCQACGGRGFMPTQYLPCLTCGGKGVVI